MTQPATPAQAPVRLAGTFDPATEAQWRALVDKALKGGDFEKRLAPRTADGLRIAPLYTRANGEIDPGLPGEAPFTRGTHAMRDGFGWTILTLIEAGSAFDANRDILADLEGGSNGILLRTQAPGQAGVPIASVADAAQVLSGVYLDLAHIELDGGMTAAETAGFILAALPALSGVPGQRRLALNLDPLGMLARFGTAGQPTVPALQEAIALANRLAASEPHARTIRASGAIAHEAGASEGQELAVMAATLVAYLKAFDASGVAPADALSRIGIHLAADTDIFLTTAKLRAARTLIARIASACGAGDAAGRVAITAITSSRMMAARDPWTNMLRTTVATAGAAFGGADAICVLPFSHPLGTPDAFARRIARNTQIVAQEESGLGRVIDPAGGSWYIEQATADLGRKAWAIFQEIEAEGGIAAALASGLVQDQIAASSAQRDTAIATGRLELTGVSAYPLMGPDGVTVAQRPPAPPVTSPQLVRPLLPKRLAVPFEALRDAADAAKTQPVVFSASLGAIADHTARSTWMRNLLASGGILAPACEGYDTPQAAAAAFQASGAQVAVIASSDTIYASFAADTARLLKAAGALHVVLAGRPGDAESSYRAAGVDRFIFAGQDAVATLTELQAIIAASHAAV